MRAQEACLYMGGFIYSTSGLGIAAGVLGFAGGLIGDIVCRILRNQECCSFIKDEDYSRRWKVRQQDCDRFMLYSAIGAIPLCGGPILVHSYLEQQEESENLIKNTSR